ncbi:Uncharacterized protein LSUE1_G007919 [Lachnellula suecica]|uniref:LDB19 N-terminal domain-containing protein n=1 Tax=Lachnellula suecica TaxID=602035 RepID=A0A8T9C2Z9_9HELO|nr:Uncharacterized protein LSUE1_G007919 [Lachnellula suecica]
MPHAISTFFRAHSHNSNKTITTHAELKRRPSNSNRRPEFSERSPSSSGSSLASDDTARSFMMPDKKRFSFPGGLLPAKSSSKSIPQYQYASLSLKMESPPAVYQYSAATSAGALVSGQLMLDIQADYLEVETVSIKLMLDTTRKKPFHGNCTECQKQSKQLKEQTLLPGPASLRKGELHSRAFFMMEGHLPASIKGHLSNIEYIIKATVTIKNGEPIKLSHILDVKRAMKAPEEPKTSTRVFPPTNITANVELPVFLHPIGEFNVKMRIDGVVKRAVETKTQYNWKVKRISWRIEEIEKGISPACTKHLAKLGNVDDVKKGVLHQDTRVIGSGDLKSGWKGDYGSPDGSVDMEFPITIQPNTRPTCDTNTGDGTVVTHVLVVEVIVSEEYCPISKLTQITPTGAARILRMHFTPILTERAGLGIPWDEEVPPKYENVPESPPGYAKADVLDYTGPPLPDYEDLEPLDIGDLDLNRPTPGNGEAPSPTMPPGNGDGIQTIPLISGARDMSHER